MSKDLRGVETAYRKVVIRSLALILLNNDHNFTESLEQYSYNGKISRFTTYYLSPM